MKSIYLILISLCFTLSADAQQGIFSYSLDRATAIDTALYKVTYNFNYTSHPNVKDRFDDVRTLLIGKKTVKDFSDIIFHYDSLCTEDMRRGKDAYSNPKGSPWPYEIILTDRGTKADIKYRLPAGTGILHYNDSIPLMQWEFVPDTIKIILGYECRLATTDFKGRKYSAWFSEEIPLPFGPYKFGALPGLILQLQDDEKQFIWEAAGFERSSEPICVYEYENEKKCSKTDARKTIERCFKTPIYFHLSAIGGGKGRIMIVGKDGKTRDATEVEDTPIPFKPIETEK